MGIMLVSLPLSVEHQHPNRMAPGPPTPRRVTIPPLHELRLELELGESCSVRLVGGNAEMFGFELLPGQDNPLGSEVKAAVFSWTGAEVEMSLPCCCWRCFAAVVVRESGRCLRNQS